MGVKHVSVCVHMCVCVSDTSGRPWHTASLQFGPPSTESVCPVMSQCVAHRMWYAKAYFLYPVLPTRLGIRTQGRRTCDTRDASVATE